MSVQGEINYSTRRLTESVIINDRLIRLINIDPHWQKHEREGITEELIIRIVKSLNNGYFFPDGKQQKDKNHFKDYPVCEKKRYKIIW
jgi:hypothetical protein